MAGPDLHDDAELPDNHRQLANGSVGILGRPVPVGTTDEMLVADRHGSLGVVADVPDDL